MASGPLRTHWRSHRARPRHRRRGANAPRAPGWTAAPMGARRGVTFPLDANVLRDFQNAGLLPDPVQASRVVDMAAAEKVFDEVTLRKPGDSRDLVGKNRRGALALHYGRIAKRE